jgi:two-component system cell cycle sensor histidine kinase/response regulator CckA
MYHAHALITAYGASNAVALGGIVLILLPSLVILTLRSVSRRRSVERELAVKIESLEKISQHVGVVNATHHQAAEALKRCQEEVKRARRIGSLGTWEAVTSPGAVSWSADVDPVVGLAGPDAESFMDRIHPDDRARFHTATVDAMSSGQPRNLRHRIVRPDGSVRHVAHLIEAAHSESGEITGLAGTMQDVTSYELLEERFRRAQRLESLGRLTAGVAHDFRNMLMLINGYGDLLLANRELPDGVREDIARIRQAGEQALAMTVQLLALSKEQPVRPINLDLNKVIEDARGLVQRLLGPGIELEINPAGEEVYVQADPGQIHQVLLNLVVNAREAMPGGGVLTIATDAADSSVLSVSDTGVGMDEQTRSRLFEPFFTTKSSGAGLGLSTVHDIVTRSGGWITVLSEPGEGTKVNVHLPRSEKTPADEKAEPSTARAAILVVDDDPTIRLLLQDILTGAGYQVIAAPDGKQAIELIKRQWVDLVITDLFMPEREGLETIRDLLVSRPSLPIIAISGQGHEFLSVARLLGARATVAKPFLSEELLKTVAGVLGSERAGTSDNG